MQKLRLLTLAAGMALVAGCATKAPQVADAPPPPPQGFVMPEGYRWSTGEAPKAQALMAETFGVTSIAPNQYKWAASLPAEGEARIVTDLKTQMVYVFKGDALVGAASISSGKPGKATSLGYWSILDKRKSHFSRKYDNAPMPFFQRIDRYGVGFHGGHNPGYAASHGCIRLPKAFAQKLFALTPVGTKVLIEG